MRQSNNEVTQEMISMEEYLEKRHEKKKLQVINKPRKNGAIERSTALELAALFV